MLHAIKSLLSVKTLYFMSIIMNDLQLLFQLKIHNFTFDTYLTMH